MPTDSVTRTMNFVVPDTAPPRRAPAGTRQRENPFRPTPRTLMPLGKEGIVHSPGLPVVIGAWRELEFARRANAHRNASAPASHPKEPITRPTMALGVCLRDALRLVHSLRVHVTSPRHDHALRSEREYQGSVRDTAIVLDRLERALRNAYEPPQATTHNVTAEVDALANSFFVLAHGGTAGFAAACSHAVREACALVPDISAQAFGMLPGGRILSRMAVWPERARGHGVVSGVSQQQRTGLGLLGVAAFEQRVLLLSAAGSHAAYDAAVDGEALRERAVAVLPFFASPFDQVGEDYVAGVLLAVCKPGRQLSGRDVQRLRMVVEFMRQAISTHDELERTSGTHERRRPVEPLSPQSPGRSPASPGGRRASPRVRALFAKSMRLAKDVAEVSVVAAPSSGD